MDLVDTPPIERDTLLRKRRVGHWESVGLRLPELENAIS